MPAPLDIDREAVRVLVVAIGPRAAAREMGIPEATVQAWSARGNWLAGVRATQAPPASMVSATVATVSPAEALQSVLAEDNRQTRIGLSRAARSRATRLAETNDPADAGDMLQVAKTAALVHGWADSAGAGVRLTIFTGPATAEKPVVDV